MVWKQGIPHTNLHPSTFQFLGITDLQLGCGLCARVLQVLEESVRRSRAVEAEGENMGIVLESFYNLLHAGVGYERVMDLMMGV